MNDRIRLQLQGVKLLVSQMRDARATLEARLATDLSAEERAEGERLLADLVKAHDLDVKAALHEQPLLGIVKFLGVLKACLEDAEITDSPVPAALIPDLMEKLAGVELGEADQVPMVMADAQPESACLDPRQGNGFLAPWSCPSSSVSNLSAKAKAAVEVLKKIREEPGRSAGAVLAERRAACIAAYGGLMQTVLLCAGNALPAEAKVILESGGRVGMEATTDAGGEVVVVMVGIHDNGARQVVARIEESPTIASNQTRH